MAKSKSRLKLGHGRGTGIPSPVDVHAGARLRVRRTLRGMTQRSLGDAIGLTFQQVQKYECGMDRMTSSRLYDLARVLDVPVQHFFDDMPAAVAASAPANTKRGRANHCYASGSRKYFINSIGQEPTYWTVSR